MDTSVQHVGEDQHHSGHLCPQTQTVPEKAGADKLARALVALQYSSTGLEPRPSTHLRLWGP